MTQVDKYRILGIITSNSGTAVKGDSGNNLQNVSNKFSRTYTFFYVDCKSSNKIYVLEQYTSLYRPNQKKVDEIKKIKGQDFVVPSFYSETYYNLSNEFNAKGFPLNKFPSDDIDDFYKWYRSLKEHLNKTRATIQTKWTTNEHSKIYANDKLFEDCLFKAYYSLSLPLNRNCSTDTISISNIPIGIMDYIKKEINIIPDEVCKKISIKKKFQDEFGETLWHQNLSIIEDYMKHIEKKYVNGIISNLDEISFNNDEEFIKWSFDKIKTLNRGSNITQIAKTITKDNVNEEK